LELDQLLAEQGDDPLDGTAERDLTGAPAHRLAEGNGQGDLREGALPPREERDGGLAGLAPGAGEVLPLGRLHATQVGDGAAELRGEGFGCLGGHAVLERGLDG